MGLCEIPENPTIARNTQSAETFEVKLKRCAADSVAMQREVDRGTLVHNAGGTDLSTVAVYDPLYCRQSDAGAGKLGRTMQALKDTENLRGIRGIKSRTIIAHKKCWGFARNSGFPKLDPAHVALG